VARLLGPDANARFVYASVGGILRSAAGLTATVYSTAVGNLLADIATYDGTNTPGATISGSALTVDGDSFLPRFWFPDGVDTVYVSVNGGTRVALNADYDARLDNVPVLDSGSKVPAANMRPYNNRGVAAASTAYAVWDLVVYRNQRVLMTTANTSASNGFISAANYTVLGPATWYNVKDYGAKGDASTDDTAAIQAAIDAAATTAQSTFGGGTVFLPAGMYITSATLVLKKHVWLRGEGQNTTTIKLATNANCHVVQNDIAASSSGTNADCVGLVDICLDGNKANQNGAGPYYGVRLETNPAVTGASGDSFFDMHHTLLNVRVYKAKGDGFHFVGRSATQVMNAFAYACDGYGYFSTFDTNYSHCESDSAGKAGFYLNNGSIRLAACKAYLSGQSDGVGAGFEFGSNANGTALAACEAQNNKGQGFYLNGSNRCVIEGVADSNSYDAVNYAGVELSGSSNNVINLVCWQGKQNNVQIGNQSYALKVTGASTGNDIRVTHSAASSATIGAALAPSTVLDGNSVRVNGTLQTSDDVTQFTLPTGAMAQNMDRVRTAMSSQGVLSSGRLWLAAIVLPAGRTISSITFVSAGTALVSGTNQWFGLFDSSRNALRLTADDTSAAWSVSTAKTLALTSSFVTTYAGLYYIGVMVAASTVPTLLGGSQSGVISTLAPVVSGSADINLTTPPTLPFQATALANAGAIPYCYVS
jgi:parallel beta-helix repeat protein